MMDLTQKHKKHLKKLGHSLKPIVMISGDGLKETIIAATNEGLEQHELIKIRIRGEDKNERNEILEKLCEETNATLIGTIGFIALIFRRNKKKPKIELPRS